MFRIDGSQKNITKLDGNTSHIVPQRSENKLSLFLGIKNTEANTEQIGSNDEKKQIIPQKNGNFDVVYDDNGDGKPDKATHFDKNGNQIGLSFYAYGVRETYTSDGTATINEYTEVSTYVGDSYTKTLIWDNGKEIKLLEEKLGKDDNGDTIQLETTTYNSETGLPSLKTIFHDGKETDATGVAPKLTGRISQEIIYDQSGNPERIVNYSYTWNGKSYESKRESVEYTSFTNTSVDVKPAPNPPSNVIE